MFSGREKTFPLREKTLFMRQPRNMSYDFDGIHFLIMKSMKILIGYRRLYETVGCNLPTEDPIAHQFQLSDQLMGAVYIGPKPNFGLWLSSSDNQYLLPGEANSMGKFEYYDNPTGSKLSGRLFFETALLQSFEVEDGICESALSGDSASREVLFRLAAPEEARFKTLLSAITGTVGLRIHRQFVLKQLSEDAVISISKRHITQHRGHSFELLENITINDIGKAELATVFGAFAKADCKILEKIGLVLSWLERAWTQMDTVTKFTSCFIPIECILESVKIQVPEGEKTALRKIAKLISKFGETDRERLAEVFERYRQPRFPSLEDRFAVFATNANLPTAEADIAAFKKFNKMRNALLHRGDTSANVVITIDENLVHSLEDIAERYVNFAIFGDSRVYQTRWRPDHKSQN